MLLADSRHLRRLEKAVAFDAPWLRDTAGVGDDALNSARAPGPE